MYVKYQCHTLIIKLVAFAQNSNSALIKYIEHTSFCPITGNGYAISHHQQLVASFRVEKQSCVSTEIIAYTFLYWVEQFAKRHTMLKWWKNFSQNMTACGMPQG